MGKKLLLIGGGGHCRSVLDTARSAGIYDEFGIIDFADSACPGVPVIGRDEDIPRLVREGWTDGIITVGSVGDTGIRRRLYAMLKEQDSGLKLPAMIDPTAAVSAGAVIREGAFIGKRAVVNTGAVIGACAIINSGAIIEHDCDIGALAHISTGTICCGHVQVGEGAHVGAGSAVRQMIRIGERAVIGIGSVVVRDIPAGATAYGNPCRVVNG